MNDLAENNEEGGGECFLLLFQASFAEAGGGSRVSIVSFLMQVTLGEDREENANDESCQSLQKRPDEVED